ncbi:MAG: T9SS type A sorting domain-containing protein [Ignavibacteria bacterium]
MRRLILSLITVVCFVLSSELYSQVPGYKLVAKNFEPGKFGENFVIFDIYLIHTDTTRFEYAGGEYYFNFQTAVANGGILSYETRSSGLPPNLQPRNPKIENNFDGTSRLMLSMNEFPSPGNGFIVPHNLVGVKIMEMVLYTSVLRLLIRTDSVDYHFVDLRLRWREAPDIPSTKIFAYIGNVLTEITDPASYSIDSSGLRIFPVELTSFVHSAINNNILLSWRTSSEINNSGFEIHRKTSDSQDWRNIGFVNGNGTTNEPKEYFFNDKVNSGKYNYRLKQIDYNGNYEYFYLNDGIVINTPLNFDLSQNYPNPFNPSTKIDFQIKNDGIVTLALYNNLGKFEKNLLNEFLTGGYYTTEANLENYPSGIYYYKLEAGNFYEVKKMILIK